MLIKSKRIRLMMIAIVLLLICTVFVVTIHRFNTKMINGRIDIGGYKLYVNSHGKGEPTVIFENGLGSLNGDWGLVQPQISKITRTFSYDRAGMGKSDKSNLERTSLNQVKELHTLLNNTKIEPPYIIVAHSIGGYNARIFAATYPKEVVGIVFVDCSHEDQFADTKNITAEQYKQFATEEQEQNIDELSLSANQVKEIRKKDALRNMPIIVLAADHKLTVDQNKKWSDFQSDIASLSNKSKKIIVKDSGHYIQLEKPQIVADAIKEIINEVKKG